jgi:hypothetical protein
MKTPIFQYIISGIDIGQIYSLCLNEFRGNLASNPERSPLMRSFGYASAGDSPDFAYRDVGGRATQGAVAEKARFPLNLVPFMSHEC